MQLIKGPNFTTKKVSLSIISPSKGTTHILRVLEDSSSKPLSIHKDLLLEDNKQQACRRRKVVAKREKSALRNRITWWLSGQDTLSLPTPGSFPSVPDGSPELLLLTPEPSTVLHSKRRGRRNKSRTKTPPLPFTLWKTRRSCI